MQERRKYSRKVVDLPATIRLSANNPGMPAKIIELSVNGAGVEFTNIKDNEAATLEEFVSMKH